MADASEAHSGTGKPPRPPRPTLAVRGARARRARRRKAGMDSERGARDEHAALGRHSHRLFCARRVPHAHRHVPPDPALAHLENPPAAARRAAPVLR
jgi:hypothetical protein